ncbi:MAG: phosphoserine phosphatase SerB [Burkholderiales bacterium]|nr:phosphoserine phosphatase SerB [Burkholderiales bacterium]MDE2608361.1 phosphoserine phosphatase SerB [Burkholderiales bacterium]
MNLVILGTTPFTPPQLAALRSLLPGHDMSVDDALSHIGSVRIADVTPSSAPQAQLEALCTQHRWDYALLPEGRRLTDFRLVAMDMDSTLITIECVDEIADYCGLKAEVSAITEAAMRGEIKDFNESLTRRVALLKGLDAGALERVYQDRLRLSPGAESMLLGVQAQGLKTLLVSGGFTYFTERLKPRLKLDATRANTLEIVDGRLTGRVLGEIVNAEVKARAVREMCEQIGAAPHQAIVIGDGSNDLQMMAAAGLSIAFRAKPVVRAQASVAFNHVGLDALLRLFDA